jgi:hypothetical protein
MDKKRRGQVEKTMAEELKRAKFRASVKKAEKDIAAGRYVPVGRLRRKDMAIDFRHH